MYKANIPNWAAAEVAINEYDAGTATDIFVYNNEPAGIEEAKMFREQLLALVEEQIHSEIEKLTPGGSEFANDTERCIEWIREQLINCGKVAAERNSLRDKLRKLEEDKGWRVSLIVEGKDLL